jgi:hypothetical protein
MVFQEIVKIIHKVGEWGIGVIRPILGKKVVIVNIYDNTAVMTVIFMQALGTLPHYGVFVRISINGTVQYNSLLNFFRKVLVLIAPYTVRYKVSDSYPFVFKRKI